MVRLAKEALVLVSTNQQDSLPVLNDVMSALGESQKLIPKDTPSLTESAVIFGRTLISCLAKKDQGGLIDNIEALEQALKAVRDRLPAEHAEIAQTMRQMVLRTPARTAIDTIEVLDALSIQLVALVGFQSDRMTRDLGWHMLTVGRLIERLISLSEVLCAFFSNAAVYTPRGFETLLVLFDSSITYRTRYQRQQDVHALMDLLVTDETNPRSIHCILRSLADEIRYLPDSELLMASMPAFDSQEESILKQVNTIRALGAFGAQLSDQISRRFFTLAVERHFAS
jgi:uncharacterized alpha-E superfamily protein